MIKGKLAALAPACFIQIKALLQVSTLRKKSIFDEWVGSVVSWTLTDCSLKCLHATLVISETLSIQADDRSDN